MSLKLVHFAFVTLATATLLAFGAWSIGYAGVWEDGGFLALGIASVVSGIALAAYLPWFLRKTRGLAWMGIAAALLLGASEPAFACAVCFGDKNSVMTQSAGSGILVLLAVIAGVLAGFGALFLSWARRARRIQA